VRRRVVGTWCQDAVTRVIDVHAGLGLHRRRGAIGSSDHRGGQLRVSERGRSSGRRDPQKSVTPGQMRKQAEAFHGVGQGLSAVVCSCQPGVTSDFV